MMRKHNTHTHTGRGGRRVPKRKLNDFAQQSRKLLLYSHLVVGRQFQAQKQGQCRRLIAGTICSKSRLLRVSHGDYVVVSAPQKKEQQQDKPQTVVKTEKVKNFQTEIETIACMSDNKPIVPPPPPPPVTVTGSALFPPEV